MKYTIEGFSQERAVQLGLSAEDLVVLRWFVDFWPSDYMVKMEHDGKKYGLVSYKGFIEQMPIVAGTKKTVARKFSRLVDANVLENVTIKKGGSYSVYRFGKNYESLVQKSENEGGYPEMSTVGQNCPTGLPKSVQPVTQSCPTGLDKVVHTNTSLLNTNLNNTNTVADAPVTKEDFSSLYRNVGLPPELEDKLDIWMKYKKEIKKPYKSETGVRCLVTKIKKYNERCGTQAVMEVIDDAMGSGYQGIVFEKLDKISAKSVVDSHAAVFKNEAGITPPSFNEIAKWAEDKYPPQTVLKFFDYWADRNFCENGSVIDWKSKLEEWGV